MQFSFFVQLVGSMTELDCFLPNKQHPAQVSDLRIRQQVEVGGGNEQRVRPAQLEGACRAIQKGTRVLISQWDSLMFGRVPKNAAPFLGTRPNTSESHSEMSTRVPFCIAGFGAGRASR